MKKDDLFSGLSPTESGIETNQLTSTPTTQPLPSFQQLLSRLSTVNNKLTHPPGNVGRPPVNNEMYRKSEEEQFYESLESMKRIVGEGHQLEELKYYLRGADGNIEIALNHLLETRHLNNKSPSLPDSSSPSESVGTSSLERVICELGEEVKCPLCSRYFEEPVSLTCFHTFCLVCLEKRVTNNMIECVVCKEVVSLNEKGVRDLKVNHYLSNIVEKLKEAPRTKVCAECNRNVCSVFCKQCKAFLCRDCNQRIHSIGLMRHHNCLSFEEDLPPPSPISSPSLINSPYRFHGDESVVAFNVKKEVCEDLFYNWIKTLWLAPSDMEVSAVLTPVKVVYLPHYLFEGELNVQYQCTVAYPARSSRPQTAGGPARGDSIWTPMLGTVSHEISILIPAAIFPEQSFIENLEPWKIEHIDPPSSLPLLWREDQIEVRPFSIEPAEAWNQLATSKIDQISEESCIKKIGTNQSTRNLKIEKTFSQQRLRRMLLPLYVGSYHYLGKEFMFVVNGSTGKVYGERPYSTGKLASIGLGALGLLSSKLQKFIS